jgi:acyl-phosphate glycerol 3-phosphate acyltransferase
MAVSIGCVVVIFGSYLLGSVSSAILITRVWTGKDIRLMGNKNAGTMNVVRSVGIFPATLVIVFDFLKGAIPILASQTLGLGETCALAGAASAIVGHSYPVYFHFRGGKGLAASIGALLVLTPVETLLMLPILGVVFLLITGSAVTGALVAFSFLIALNIWRGYSLAIILSPLVFLVVMGLCSIPDVLQGWHKNADKKKLIAYWLNPSKPYIGNHRVAIVTDSVASLPSELCSQEKLFVMPLALILPDGIYHDGVDIEPRAYYRRLREEQIHPKTSAPSPGEYIQLYEQLLKSYEAIVVLTLPQELSQTWSSARLAVEESPEHQAVEVIDTRVAGPAQGFVALAAARAAKKGAGLDPIVQLVQLTMKNVGLIVVLDTLNYLLESGRVKDVQKWVQSAIQVYPILSIIEGKIRLLGLSRTKSKAVERMILWLESALPQGKVNLAYVHTDALEEAKHLEERLSNSLQPVEHFVTEMTPVIGAHTGPGLVGVAWWSYPTLKITAESEEAARK